MAEERVIVTMAQEHMIVMEGSSVHGSNEYCTASFGSNWEFKSEASRARLMKLRSECGSDLEYEIEASREQWSQMESDTDLEAEIAAENVKVFRSLQEQWPGGFFRDGGDEWVVGRKIAEGGWAEVFEAQLIRPDGRKSSTPWVLKVLKKSISLRYLQTLLPSGVLQNGHSKRYGCYWNGYSCSIYGGILLKNGRFAFQMTRYWGDLRQLIDIKMQHNHKGRPPFAEDTTVTKCMLDIAEGMLALHNDNIIHRDLNASSVQIRPQDKDFDTIHGRFDCKVTGFESSVGVVGTGFWRAPEILLGVKNQDIKSNLFSQKSDVYSFAMTCYEILTGHIPLEDHYQSDYDAVLIQDGRPDLPSDTKPWVEVLLKRCWHREPSERPTFREIVDILKENSRKNKEKYDIFSHQASTWGEQNDPRRVVTGSDETGVGLKADFPILIQMLGVALQRCDEKVLELSQQQDKVGVFHFQCAHLVDTISPGVDALFRQFPQLLECMKEPMIPGTDLRRWFKCVTFGIHSVVDLTHKLHTVVEILSVCGEKEWWRTALRLGTTPPHPQLARWSMFGLALRQYEWSMDIAQFAIMKMTKLFMPGHGVGSESDDSSFIWCEKRQRLVLQLGDTDPRHPQNIKGELAASLRVAVAKEAEDRVALVKNLETLKTQRLTEVGWYPKFFSSLQPADVIASFLMQKVRGPVPQASYLPYSVKIDHAANLVFRREFAVGGFGTSVSEYKWCDEIVAVKRVWCKGSRRLRFEEEAAALATVQHPNVVQLMGCAFREKDEMLMLVMEYMEEDLRVIIERRCPNPGAGSSPPFPLIVATDIMLQIAEGMQFLREHKIMHGDLKAKNVLVNSAYRLLDHPIFNEGDVPKRLSYLLTPESYYVVKLADFGEARYMPLESNHIVTRMSGTLRWMAPEMVHIRNAEVPSEYNWRADVYSYALTCYEILTGHTPFHDVPKDTLKISRQRPVLDLGEGLPAILVNLITRCLDKIPEKRPAFSEICKDLWQCKVETTTSIFRPS